MTIDETAMKRLEAGHCGHFSPLLRELANQAEASNAGTASVTFSFVEDDEIIEGAFVPQVTVTMRKPEVA